MIGDKSVDFVLCTLIPGRVSTRVVERKGRGCVTHKKVSMECDIVGCGGIPC